MSGIPGLLQVCQVQNRHRISIRLFAKKPLQVGDKLRIGRRNIKVALIQQAQIHLAGCQQGSGGLFGCSHPAFHCQAVSFHTCNAGIGVSVERI